MWHELLIAFSLVMIIEGIIPFISPVQWRTVVLTVARSSDKQIRIVGLREGGFLVPFDADMRHDGLRH